MPQIINLGNSPAADADNQLLVWKADAPNPNVSVSRNVSVQVPKMTATQAGITPTPPNDATKFLDGTGHFTVPPSGGGSSSFAKSRGRQFQVTADGTNGIHTFVPQGDQSLNPRGTSWTDGEVPQASPLRGPGSSRKHASADTYAGWNGSSLYQSGLDKINAVWRGWMGRTTDIRFWIVLTDAFSGGLTVSDTPSGNYAGFRFSAIGGDTQIQCCTSDGSTQTVASSGVTPDLASHSYGILFDDVTPAIKFYIDGNLVATITTHLPTSGSLLAMSALAAWHSATANPIIGAEFFAIETHGG